jgi:hypothetical protein
MKSRNLASQRSDTLDDEAEDIFQMTNLSPRMTGLPMSVWASPRAGARHDVRVKVNMSHGNRMNIDNTAVVAVRPSPRVVAGHLDVDDQRLVTEWINLNFDALVAYWAEEIDTGQFIERLKIVDHA